MFKLTLVSTFFASLALQASAADICAYTSRSCAGSYGCCTGIAEGTCCYWPYNSGYGWSVRFTNMPLTGWWLGRTYGDTCTTSTGGGGSSDGSTCVSVWDGPSYLNWLSANWDSDYRTRRRSIEGNDTSCVLPNVVGFIADDGEEHLVKVPEGKFGEVNQLVKAEKYAELLKLESAHAQ
ncbi:hypothetical protein FPV67DRAFT_926154 [Lyophyllum atratum]|nr:hypothetical protein FPV67DRAFT_926154 [Lyophyllum atratum]